jgi:error-prone DNA polymerase
MQIAIVGAGYSGGDADRLRRDMAAWRRTWSLEKHRARLAEGFAAKGIAKEFADRLYSQIEGFAEYGFPESHAASFALLVYASSWLKVHHPAEFAAALVNSQPMGFYSPSTILQDAQRHGVELRPVRVERSDWDCTIEERAIRVGLRQVKGLGEEAARRIEQARASAPFASLADLAERASLAKLDLDVLAEGGALEDLVGERREAMWRARAPTAPGKDAPGETLGLFAGIEMGDPPPKLAALTRSEQLTLDYARTGLSVADHPMRIARPSLPKRVRRSSELQTLAHGVRAESAGLVICRQRPQTASGVVFITMEDEEGFINLILYARVFDELRHVATTSAMLLATGTIEREGDVVYIVTRALEPVGVRKRLPSMSRDFH